MPWDDWQFYAVTAVALLCAWVIVGPLLLGLLGRGKRGKGKRVSLTIDRKSRTR